MLDAHSRLHHSYAPDSQCEDGKDEEGLWKKGQEILIIIY